MLILEILSLDEKTAVYLFFEFRWAIAQKPFELIDQAKEFLISLTAEQRELVSFALETLPNLDGTICPDSFTRERLSLSEMSQEQIDKTYNLLKTYLSESGYDQMQQIIDLENYLAVVENNPYKEMPVNTILPLWHSQ